jgi:hypothetical protein
MTWKNFNFMSRATLDKKDFLVGMKEMARAFGVKPRQMKRWLTKAQLSYALPKLNFIKHGNSIVVPKEHAYFLWLRIYRFHRTPKMHTSMALAGCNMFKYLNKRSRDENGKERFR